MSQSTSFATKFFSPDFLKSVVPSTSIFPVGLDSLMDAQRKNIEAITEAQKIAVENIQAIAQRQVRILSQLVEDNTALAQQMMSVGTPEEKVSRQADLVRDAYDRSVSDLSELAELVSKTNREAGDVLHKRVTASLTELKSTVVKNSKKMAA